MGLFGPSDFDDFLNFFAGFFKRFSRGSFLLEAIFMDREKRPEDHTCRKICEGRANELAWLLKSSVFRDLFLGWLKLRAPIRAFQPGILIQPETKKVSSVRNYHKLKFVFVFLCRERAIWRHFGWWPRRPSIRLIIFTIYSLWCFKTMDFHDTLRIFILKTGRCENFQTKKKKFFFLDKVHKLVPSVLCLDQAGLIYAFITIVTKRQTASLKIDERKAKQENEKPSMCPGRLVVHDHGKIRNAVITCEGVLDWESCCLPVTLTFRFGVSTQLCNGRESTATYNQLFRCIDLFGT